MKNEHDLYRIKGTVTIANEDLTKPRTQVININDLFVDTHPVEAMNQAIARAAPSYANVYVIDEDLHWELATEEEVEQWEIKLNREYVEQHSHPLVPLDTRTSVPSAVALSV